MTDFMKKLFVVFIIVDLIVIGASTSWYCTHQTDTQEQIAAEAGE